MYCFLFIPSPDQIQMRPILVILLFFVTIKASSQIDTIKKKYAGQKLTLMAYETGHFTGIPASYFNYQPIRQDNGFHFRQYLIVVSNLTNKADK